MTSQPTFSICIPNYNHGKFIAEAIQSVLDQDYEHFEIVIADNASQDNSLEVIAQFDDPRIRVYQNNYNIGFAPNLQRVTQYAQNDYINLLSADDVMKPGALSTLAEIIQRHEDDAEYLVLYSQAEGFTNAGATTSLIRKVDDGHYFTNFPASELKNQPDALIYHEYDGKTVMADALKHIRSFAPFLTTVYSRELWQAVEGYNAVRTIGPDKFFNFKLLSQFPKVIYIERPLFRYRDYESDNRAAKYRTLKQPIDDYLYTIEYKDEYLKTLGLRQQDLIDTFIDRVCLKEGLSRLGYRNYGQGFRLFAFALASYPLTALRNRKFYMLLGLLLTGPLSLLIAPPLLERYKLARA